MSEVAVESLNLSKKFKKGEMFDSLSVECQHIVDKNMCHDIVDNVL
jgi:hypothetical protein